MFACNILVVPEQSELLLANLDGAATELGNQDLVASLNAQRNPLAILVVETGANGEDLALIELLDSAIGKEDAGGGLGLGLHALHEDAVQEGCERLDVLEHGLVEALLLAWALWIVWNIVMVYHDYGCCGGE
jgi:hypothetical protein